MNKEIKKELLKISHPEGKDFQKRIVNTNYPLLGSRMVEIRKLAKSLSKNINLEKQEKDNFYEEVLLRGLILAYQNESIINKIPQIRDYLNLVDSWALCDSFCSTFKVKNNEREELFEMLKSFLQSKKVFEKRFALIMFLIHFLKFTKDGEKLKRPKKLSLGQLKEKDLTNLYI